MHRGIVVATLAALLPCVCLAGPKKDHPDHPEVASLEFPAAVHPSVNTDTSSAATESIELPDAPEGVSPRANVSLEYTAAVAPKQARISLASPEFSPAVSPMYSMPLVTAAIRMGGHNFNTDDGSSLSAFAICYRLNRRSSVQVIPGDPAPVKLPVATMANNMGVTVGMVYHLSKRP